MSNDCNSCDSDDDVPQLSADTFAALQEFYSEQEQREKKLQSVETHETTQLIFDENWQLSQFWYDENTAEVLSKIALKLAGPQGRIALISCPTIYPTLKQIAHDNEVTLFEYDQRFAAYGSDFILYDYKSPLDIPRNLADTYDVVIADPPFLSEECLTKTAVTIKFLTQKNIIICTGAVMVDLVNRLLNLKKCSFTPRHKNNLGNDFSCFTNFDVDELL